MIEADLQRALHLMIQLYKEGKGLDDLKPVEETVVAVLTRPERAFVCRPTDTPAGLRAEPFGVNIITEGDRGFGEEGRFYFIDAEGKRIFQGDAPFRHLDKCTGREREFLVSPTTTVDDLISAFREAGFEVLNRRRAWNE